MNELCALCLLSLLWWSVASADEAPPASIEAAPAPAGEASSLEPEVTIHEEKDRTVTEYRVNGRLYMVKITPRHGPPYYLMDLDGDGELDTVEEDPAAIVVPQWILFRW